MGALPKRRISTHRKGRRRSDQHVKLPTLVACAHCSELKRPHFRCQACGK